MKSNIVVIGAGQAGSSLVAKLPFIFLLHKM